MKVLVPLKQLGITLPCIALSRTSLAIKDGANEEDLARLEQWLDAVGGSSLFWWGDYLNHLADTRGEEYARAKAASGYAPASLWQAAWVCRRVAASRRLEALTFSHHSEVAALSPTDQEVWLCRADEEGWSSKQLRAEIRQSKAQVTNGADQAPIDQRASRASQGFEVFITWYESEVESFTPDQQAGWDDALRPLVASVLSRLSEAEIEALRHPQAA